MINKKNSALETRRNIRNIEKRHQVLWITQKTTHLFHMKRSRVAAIFAPLRGCRKAMMGKPHTREKLPLGAYRWEKEGLQGARKDSLA
jgi:hypothetical protein